MLAGKENADAIVTQVAGGPAALVPNKGGFKGVGGGRCLHRCAMPPTGRVPAQHKPGAPTITESPRWLALQRNFVQTRVSTATLGHAAASGGMKFSVVSISTCVL